MSTSRPTSIPTNKRVGNEMKTKLTVKLISLAIAALIALSALSACTVLSCGPKGEEASWGRFVFTLPAGLELKGGNAVDPEAQGAFTLRSKSEPAYYIACELSGLENCESSITAAKAVNEGAEDVVLEFGGVEWRGVSCKLNDRDYLHLYARFGDEGSDEYALVRSYGFSSGGTELSTFLGTFKLRDRNA